MRGAILLIPQYVFMVWCLVKQSDNFTFYLYLKFPLKLKDHCPFCFPLWFLSYSFFLTSRSAKLHSHVVQIWPRQGTDWVCMYMCNAATECKSGVTNTPLLYTHLFQSVLRCNALHYTVFLEQGQTAISISESRHVFKATASRRASRQKLCI
jgi:hypothetical protein